MCMYDTTYSASFGVQTAFHVARSRLVCENWDRIGTHDHTASSLWVTGGGWISAKRSADAPNVFARRPDCGDVWRHLSSGRWRTHGEAEDGESGLGDGDNESRFCQCFLGWDFSSFSHRRRTLGHHVEERLDQQPSWVERTACAEARVAQACRVNVWLRVYFLAVFVLGNEMSTTPWQMATAWRFRNGQAPSRKLTLCRRTLLRQQSLSELCF